MQVTRNSLLTFLFPLALVTPYVFLGPYGVTLFELLIVVCFFWSVMRSEQRKIFLPQVMKVYLLLFFLGWLGATLNGSLNWDITVGLPDLKFFYYFLLAVAGYNLGYRYYQSLDFIVSSKTFQWMLMGLLLFILIYPYLSYAQRFSVLHFFYPPNLSADKLVRFHYTRFPGLGVNANVFAFMLYTVLLFCFETYLRKGSMRLVSVGLFFAILVTGSKSILILTLVSILALLLGTYSLRNLRHVKRIFLAFFVLILLGLLFGIFVNFTVMGHDLLEHLSVFQRMSAVLDGDNLGGRSASGRFVLWGMGMQRVELAPFLGIAPDRYVISDGNILYFITPHNEFIAFWMLYGLLGLLAHILLLVGLLCMNVGHRDSFVWCVYYVVLIVFMSCDAAFSSVRFQPLFFMLVGINMMFLKQKSIRKVEVQRDKFVAVAG